MSGPPPFVSVVVPVRDGAESLAGCLRALAGQRYPPDRREVVVVDNGSARPPVEVVAAHDGARLVHEAQPGSYRARNTGLREARGDVVAFTDADCRPCPDWLAAGVACLAADPAVGAVAGRVRVTPHDTRRPRAVELYEIRHAFPQAAYVSGRHFGATANLFARRAVIDDVGAFDPRLVSGGDREWGARVHDAGYLVRYCESAVVEHPARETWAALYDKFIRVHRGALELRRRVGEETRAPGARVLRYVPPVRSVWRVWTGRAEGLDGAGDKARYSGALLAVRYLGVAAGWQARFESLRRDSCVRPAEVGRVRQREFGDPPREMGAR